ncbi:MAG: proline racemase family protein [Rhodovibrio sp.]|nr:proline racemase family protein [Rhodovibrio sp.]
MADNSRLREIEVVDVSVGGDVHRVVVGGVLPLPGASVHDQMRYLEEKADGLRRLLINEPYGAQHMCVDLLVPAKRADCSLGFVIMEVMGYPVYSGSNSLATGAAVVEAGLAARAAGEWPDTDGVTRRPVRLEAPGGPVELTAELVDGRVRKMRTAATTPLPSRSTAASRSPAWARSATI